MPFTTAWIGLVDIAKLAAKDTVLITAASSSVGLAPVQVARREGAIPRYVQLTRDECLMSDRAQQKYRKNRVFKSLYKPLTYLGVERTLFYFVCVGAVGQTASPPCGGGLMLRLDKVIKPWKESASLNDHISLYGFWNGTAFPYQERGCRHGSQYPRRGLQKP